jgi:lysozyme
MTYTFSDNGVALLKKLEGFSPRTYVDSAGKKTIGYGHVIVPGDGVAPGDILEEVQATGLLQRDVQKAVDVVNAAVTSSIDQNMFDALVIFTYNVGAAAFQNSTLLQLLNKGDYRGASEQFPVWCKVHTKQGMFIELPGLKNRRLAEQALFLTPMETNHELA